jgi:transcriptional regulator with XRE-family HTH domain
VDGDGQRLGRALLALRQQHHLTQEELAIRANKVPSYISRFERGEYDNPSYSTLNDLALAFGLRNASAFMRRLEYIDRAARPIDVEVDRIRELANEIELELCEVPASVRAQALAEAIRVLKAGVRRNGTLRQPVATTEARGRVHALAGPR